MHLEGLAATLVHHNMVSAPTIPPFLRLPTELRLMIYNYLLPQRCHLIVSAPNNSRSVHLVMELLPLDILRVCRFIHHEALTILGPQLTRLLHEPPKLIADGTVDSICALDLVFCHVATTMYTDLRKPNRKRANEVQSPSERKTTKDVKSIYNKAVNPVLRKAIRTFALKAVTRMLAIQQSEAQTLQTTSKARLEILVPQSVDHGAIHLLHVPRNTCLPVAIVHRAETTSTFDQDVFRLRTGKSCRRIEDNCWEEKWAEAA
jgi:hypothetical protein